MRPIMVNRVMKSQPLKQNADNTHPTNVARERDRRYELLCAQARQTYSLDEEKYRPLLYRPCIAAIFPHAFMDTFAFL